MNWDRKAQSINLRPQSARPVKTANMLMALTKRMFPLKMLRMFHRKRHLLLSGHMRGQHVSNAYHKAATQNGEVVSASVRVQTSVCPECGRSYISGGVTDTQIRYYKESNPYQQDLKQTDGIKLRGANVDEIG